MDFLTSCLVIIFVAFLVFTLCGWCCRNNTKETSFATVTIPTATTVEVAPQGFQNPPYPVQQSMMPQPGQGMPPQQYIAPYPPVNQTPYPPGPGFVPYPVGNQPPYPQYQPGFSPAPGYSPYPGYPPAPGNSMQQQNPPSYDEATSGVSNMYNKQSAYNPNFK